MRHGKCLLRRREPAESRLDRPGGLSYKLVIQATTLSMVCSGASTVTAMPKLRAACVVIGPMDATRTLCRRSTLAAAAKFCTVDALVKAIQSGRCGALKISRARSAADSGMTAG